MEAIRWDGQHLYLLDQRMLPSRHDWLTISDWRTVAQAISNMVVRGAPAIAIAAAYGLALAVRAGDNREEAADGLAKSRPTAVNLQWALKRLESVPDEEVAQEAERIHAEDRNICERLGQHGAPLLDGGILTICNTGALATGGHGTALGMVRSAITLGRSVHVYALETRPYLQGARLTATECVADHIPCTLLTDGMAGALLASGRVNTVVVGCDRVAANGDTANKIGTYSLAVLAAHHNVPLYVAMPISTLDRSCTNGSEIPIEERQANEVRTFGSIVIAPDEVAVWNPAFDVTPAELIAGWVTEHGIWRVPFPPPMDDPSRNS
jgi:methylthioribose-1-phosphate isomerase